MLHCALCSANTNRIQENTWIESIQFSQESQVTSATSQRTLITPLLNVWYYDFLEGRGASVSGIATWHSHSQPKYLWTTDLANLNYNFTRSIKTTKIVLASLHLNKFIRYMTDKFIVLLSPNKLNKWIKGKMFLLKFKFFTVWGPHKSKSLNRFEFLKQRYSLRRIKEIWSIHVELLSVHERLLIARV